MPPEDAGGEVTVGPLKLKGVPPWAVVVALVVITCGSAFGIYKKATAPDYELVSYKEANAAQQSVLSEYEKHFGETPEKVAELMNDARGKQWVSKYSDPCVMLSFQDLHGHVTSKLVVDISRGAERAGLFDWLIGQVAPPVLAAGRCVTHTDKPVRTWYGQRRGDWVEYVRLYADGCQSVQWVRPSDGAFDSHPDGTPKVRWDKCVH